MASYTGWQNYVDRSDLNGGFERTSGYAREEVLGDTPALLKSGRQEPAFYRGMWETLLRGEVYRGEIVNRRRDGQLYHTEQTITPMKDAAGTITHFVSVGKDVTEQRRSQERELEMRLAARVQRRFYPRRAPRVPGFDIAGAAYPSTLTCGDYFDFLDLPGGRLGLVVADVCGHGMGPALLMAETRAYLRAFSQEHGDLDEVLHRVNETLLDDLESGSFVTMLLASLDVATRRLTYANAGHPSGYVMDRRGEVRHVLPSSRVPLGIRHEERAVWQQGVALEPGDVVVLVTDGFLESRAPDGRFFDDAGLLELVRAHRHQRAQQILDGLYQGVLAFQQGVPHEDDLTAVICKVDDDA